MMQKLSLSAVLIWGLSITAHAQQRSAGSAAPEAVSAPYTAADTVQALHRMFSHGRAKGGFLAGMGAVTLVVGPFILESSSDDTPTTHGNLGNLVATGVGVILVAPVTIYGLSKVLSSSRKKEQKVVSAYTEKRVLEKKYQNALRPSYFLPNPQTGN